MADWVEDGLDVQNVHDNYAFVVAMKRKLRTGKPVVWMMNDFPGAAIPSKRFRAKILNALFDTFNGNRWVRRWYCNAVQGIDWVVVLADRISRKYLEELFQLLPSTIRIGLDLQKFRWEPGPQYRGGRQSVLVSNGLVLPHR